MSAIQSPGPPIRVLLVDDEPLARERLRTLLVEEPGIVLVGECADGQSAIKSMVDLRPDLVFLDVQMPELSGFDVLEALPPGVAPAIVFVTAHDQYALEAFEVNALDYLLKPFDRERFERALVRARAHLASEMPGMEGRLRFMLEELRGVRRRTERLVIRSRGRVLFLRTDAIDWIEAAGNYARIHVGTEDHLLRETMKQLEARLDPDVFVRIHRSAIVNLDRVRELQPSFHGEYVVVLADGTELTSSRGHGEGLKRLAARRPPANE